MSWDYGRVLSLFAGGPPYFSAQIAIAGALSPIPAVYVCHPDTAAAMLVVAADARRADRPVIVEFNPGVYPRYMLSIQ